MVSNITVEVNVYTVEECAFIFTTSVTGVWEVNVVLLVSYTISSTSDIVYVLTVYYLSLSGLFCLPCAIVPL